MTLFKGWTELMQSSHENTALAVYWQQLGTVYALGCMETDILRNSWKFVRFIS